MKTLKVIAQIVGYASIAVAALMFCVGDIGAMVMMLVVGVVLLAGASKLIKPAPPAQPSAVNVGGTEASKADPPSRKTSLLDDLPDWESKKTKQKRQAEERKRQAAAAGVACCPYCGSTSLAANKKGYGIGKGVVGAWAVGPIGLAAGNIGRQKVMVTCLNCGRQFKPGKGRI